MGSNAPVRDRASIEAEENFIMDAQFLLQDSILERGITRTELAQKAGITKARLSQIMKAGANPTLRTVASLFHAAGESVRLTRTQARDVKRSSWVGSDEPLISATNDPSIRALLAAFQGVGLEVAEFPHANDNPIETHEMAIAA
jgi:DNA-binding phage protein